ncbi:hypothetical protein [Streptomyces albus]|uniref:hypothetical protein n=1 Tax=Streptomyces albus TaxID=1888 RepID=UPI00131DEED0|nr:hypothetical protein [Streptomyces albus]
MRRVTERPDGADGADAPTPPRGTGGEDGKKRHVAMRRHNSTTLPRIRAESPASDLHHPETAAADQAEHTGRRDLLDAGEGTGGTGLRSPTGPGPVRPAAPRPDPVDMSCLAGNPTVTP